MLAELDLPDDLLDVEVDPETAKFIAEQQSAITSTDVPGILGLSRYKTPLSVCRSKWEPPSPKAMSLRGWIGGKLESLVAELFVTAMPGTRLRTDNGFHRHPDHEWLACHLDRRIVGSPRTVVELKTRGSTRGWGPDGSAEVAPDVWTQVQVQMAITGGTECYVACLFNSADFRVYRVPYDPGFIETLLPELERFWFGHVVAHVEPAPTGSDVDTALMMLLPGGDTGLLKSATPAQEMLALRLKVAKAETARAKLAQEEVENIVRRVIGEADGLIGAFGKITNRRSKDAVHVDWELVAADYRRALDAIIRSRGTDGVLPLFEALPGVDSLSAEILDAVPSLHTTLKPGTRRLLTTFTED